MNLSLCKIYAAVFIGQKTQAYIDKNWFVKSQLLVLALEPKKLQVN